MMTMKIGITLKPQAYTPEAFAYQQYLEKKGWDVQLALEQELDPNNDINIYFMGIRPFWKKIKGSAKEIHEYQSLSIPPYAKAKNVLKCVSNRKPDGRIFLNQAVHDGFKFNKSIPSIYRDMGIDGSLFQSPSKDSLYDIVYAGTIQGRQGLINTIQMLAAKGFTILLIGSIPEPYLEQLKHPKIILTGRVSRNELPKLYKQCRLGLNFTPDLYPFNIQTSTKTLEYLASGLHVISNRYLWMEHFCKEIKYKPIWLDENLSVNIINHKIQNILLPDMTPYLWDNILNVSSFEDFLLKIIKK